MSTDQKVLKLVKGDIAVQQVQAIVNAANSSLILGAGVAGAIRRRGGPTIQSECSLLAPKDPGKVVVTSAGKLDAEIILHAVTMHPGGNSSVDIIAECTRNILRIAAERQLHSIAMPAIGCGIAGVNLHDGLSKILEEVKVLDSEGFLNEFRLVMHTNEEFYNAWQTVREMGLENAVERVDT